MEKKVGRFQSDHFPHAQFVENLQGNGRCRHAEKGRRHVGGGLTCVELRKNPRIFTRTRGIRANLKLTIWRTKSDHLLRAKCVIERIEGIFCDDYPVKFFALVAIYGTSVFPKVFRISSLV